jgi:hypothetical protein
METGLLTLGLGCVAGFYRKKIHTARWLWLDNSELAQFVTSIFTIPQKKFLIFYLPCTKA